MWRPGRPGPRLCSSASTYPSSSVCTPSRPVWPPTGAERGGRGGPGRGRPAPRRAPRPPRPGPRRVGRHAAGSACSTTCVGEQLVHQAARSRPGRPASGRGTGGAVPEADHPLGGVVTVIGELLDGPAGDRGQYRVRRPGQPPNRASRQRGEHHGRATSSAKSASRPLGQPGRCGTALGPEEREPVLVGPSAGSAWRPGRAAAGPGPAGRARCWPAPSPLPARAGGSSTAAGGGL